MTVNQLSQLNLKLNSLSVFRSILNDAVIKSLCDYLSCEENGVCKVSLYSEFVFNLYSSGFSFAKHIQNLVNDNENAYIKAIGAGKTVDTEIKKRVITELSYLQELASLSPEILKGNLPSCELLADFLVENVDIIGDYNKRCENIGSFGYGIYSKHRMFYLDDNAQIVPVENPDAITLSALVDYKREQKIIIDNTLALLAGKPAANVLLTGDAGTGKSSTIKAVVNEFYSKGLRIVQVRKEQLYLLPVILDKLSQNPLKFIIFIDDLSFVRDDDNFSALKAVLEGSVYTKSANVAIYATSNRRHLVKETFSSREGDDIHRNDTMQEILSLSARFGIQVSFYKPDKQTYLHIVGFLAEEKGIKIPQPELEVLAERFALEKGGRSARAATQFIDSLLSNM